MQLHKVGIENTVNPNQPKQNSDKIKTVRQTDIYKNDELIQTMSEEKEDGRKTIIIKPCKDGKPIEGTETRLDFFA